MTSKLSVLIYPSSDSSSVDHSSIEAKVDSSSDVFQTKTVCYMLVDKEDIGDFAFIQKGHMLFRRVPTVQ